MAEQLALYGAAGQDGRHDEIDLVLWGRALEFGKGVVVQPYLTIPTKPRADARIWKITIPTKDESLSVELDVPRLRYEFAPIVLSQEIVKGYTTPNRLPLYDAPIGGKINGRLGSSYEARNFKDGAFYVEAPMHSGKYGWLRLPKLSDKPNEVTDFVGAVIRLLRTDWQGSIDLLTKVIDNPHTKTALKTDSLLYKARAKEEMGQDGSADIQKAYALSQLSKETVMYSVMVKLSAMSRFLASNRTDKVEEYAGMIRSEITENDILFPQDDLWVSRVNTVIDILKGDLYQVLH